MNIEGKTCVLTGATGGIGEAFAQALAGAGARLILVSRSQDKLDSLLASLPGEGHVSVAADLSSARGRAAVLAASTTGVDLLVNNAGVSHFGLLEAQSEELLHQMMEVNVIAPMLLTRMLLPVTSQHEAVIVNVGSSFGSIGFAGYCGYSASKFALRGFTEALRRELADTRVQVLYLSPRATATAMNAPEVTALNEELGNTTDSPERVADELMAQLRKSQSSRFIGWPERFFVKLNGLFPSVVDSALLKQLPVIRRQALATKTQDR
jgi:short-subunit dehydrogenase